MVDELKNRGAQDRARISMSEEHEVRYWTKALGVSKEQLAAHGPFRAGCHRPAARFIARSACRRAADLHSICFSSALGAIIVVGWSGGSRLSMTKCSADIVMPSLHRWGAISTPNFVLSSRRRKCSPLVYSAASI